MWSNLVAVCGIIFLCGFVGLVMYSKYFDCDPLNAQVSHAMIYASKMRWIIYIVIYDASLLHALMQYWIVLKHNSRIYFY